MAQSSPLFRQWHLGNLDMHRHIANWFIALNAMLLTNISHADDERSIDPVVLSAQKQRIEIIRQASTATVAIFGLDGGGGGSGVIVTPDGYALTNYHVSSACGDHMRCGLNDGKMYDAVIVGIDATGDLSLIKLLGRDDFPTAPLGDSNQVHVGQWCFAAGNPFVLASNLQPTVSLGIVSGTNRYQYPAGTLLEYADCIQTDAAINPGNSGGPLFNLAGEIIGINGRCSFEKRGRVNVGVGYAISANQVKYFLGMLLSGRLVDHATLGATVSTDDAGRVLVSNILSTSDAYRRGLRFGDEIVSLADREVRTTNSFKNILGTLPKGWRVPLEIRRDGQPRTLLVRLAGVHTEKQLTDLVSSEVVPGHAEPEQGEPDEEPAQEPLEEAPTDGSPAGGNSDLSAEGKPNVALVESMLESRTGFANYYFNRSRREAVWERLQKLGDFPAERSVWTLTGTVAGESTPIKILLDKHTGRIQIGSRSIEVEFGDAMSEIISSRREGGLLVALHALKQLLQLGPEKLGDTIYLGTLPVYQTSATDLASQPRQEVLQSLWYDATARFYVAPESEQVSLVEIFGDAGQDPVEVYMDQYQEQTTDEKVGLRFPTRIRLQYGTEPMLLLSIQSVTFGPEAEEQGGVQ